DAPPLSKKLWRHECASPEVGHDATSAAQQATNASVERPASIDAGRASAPRPLARRARTESARSCTGRPHSPPRSPQPQAHRPRAQFFVANRAGARKVRLPAGPNPSGTPRKSVAVFTKLAAVTAPGGDAPGGTTALTSRCGRSVPRAGAAFQEGH